MLQHFACEVIRLPGIEISSVEPVSIFSPVKVWSSYWSLVMYFGVPSSSKCVARRSCFAMSGTMSPSQNIYSLILWDTVAKEAVMVLPSSCSQITAYSVGK